MITDLLSNSNCYFVHNKYFNTSIQFIDNALKHGLDDGEYELFGKDVFARVMTYSLKDRDECSFESHLEYVDIQAPLSGSEGIEWMPIERLVPETEYDTSNDVIIYRQPTVSLAKIDALPGSFVMFFAQDGHMPQLFTFEHNRSVKKIVVKLRKTLFD